MAEDDDGSKDREELASRRDDATRQRTEVRDSHEDEILQQKMAIKINEDLSICNPIILPNHPNTYSFNHQISHPISYQLLTRLVIKLVKH